jgi:hypothetical protein
VRIEKEQGKEIGEMEQTGQRRNRVPASMREEFRVRRGALYVNSVGCDHGAGEICGGSAILLPDVAWLASTGGDLITVDILGLQTW